MSVFEWKNPHFLFKNPDFLWRNSDFLLKTDELKSKNKDGNAMGAHDSWTQT